MNPALYGIVEMVLSFGLVIAFCGWQLRVLKRSKRRQKTGDRDGGQFKVPDKRRRRG